MYDMKVKKEPTVITFVKDPIVRMASAYNYIRHGALSTQHQERNVKLLGNETVAQCFYNSTCAEINAMRKSCSLQALSLCGDDYTTCKVHWHLVDSTNYKEKLAPMIERAIENMKEKVLFTGVVEQMDKSLDFLQEILPTWFEGAAEFSRVADAKRKKKAENETKGDFDRSWKSSKSKPRDHLALNMASSYPKPTAQERKDMIEEGVCYADFAVYNRAVELLEERTAICNANIAQRELNKKMKRRQAAKKILEEEL